MGSGGEGGRGLGGADACGAPVGNREGSPRRCRRLWRAGRQSRGFGRRRSGAAEPSRPARRTARRHGRRQRARAAAILGRALEHAWPSASEGGVVDAEHEHLPHLPPGARDRERLGERARPVQPRHGADARERALGQRLCLLDLEDAQVHHPARVHQPEPAIRHVDRLRRPAQHQAHKMVACWVIGITAKATPKTRPRDLALPPVRIAFGDCADRRSDEQRSHERRSFTCFPGAPARDNCERRSSCDAREVGWLRVPARRCPSARRGRRGRSHAGAKAPRTAVPRWWPPPGR